MDFRHGCWLVTVCSQCGVVKGEVNHWFICWWSGRHFHTKPIDDDPAMQREADVFTVCGDGCAHKVYQQFLDFLKNTQ
jgi:hypothetical protein